MIAQGMTHAIGSDRFPAPQGTLMATLIKGLLSHNLDWQFVLVGVFFAVTMELCEVRSLAFAVGAYLPLSTTLPIFVGGVIRWIAEKKNGKAIEGGRPLRAGFGHAVAGGALAGVLVAILAASSDKLPSVKNFLASVALEGKLVDYLGHSGYDLLGVAFFARMGSILFRIATRNGGKVKG